MSVQSSHSASSRSVVRAKEAAMSQMLFGEVNHKTKVVAGLELAVRPGDCIDGCG